MDLCISVVSHADVSERTHATATSSSEAPVDKPCAVAWATLGSIGSMRAPTAPTSGGRRGRQPAMSVAALTPRIAPAHPAERSERQSRPVPRLGSAGSPTTQRGPRGAGSEHTTPPRSRRRVARL
jgi:hypothetical protein